MSGAFRLTVIFIALAAIGLGCYDIANPYRVGMFGYDSRLPQNSSIREATVTRIYPGSPVERAGLRVGDVVLWSTMSPQSYFDALNKRANQVVILPVRRNGRIMQMRIVTAQYVTIKPIEEGPLALLLLAIFAATGILVALRGARRPEVLLLSFFFSAYALSMATGWLVDVASTPAAAFAAGVITHLINIIVFYILLRFVAIFPPMTSPLRVAIGRAAFPFMSALTVLYFWAVLSDFFTGAKLLRIDGSSAPWWFNTALWAVANLLLLGGAIEGLIRVNEEHRAQMRWVGGAIILSTVPFLIWDFVLLVSPSVDGGPWLTLLGDVPLLAISYAILRHRLVDLSIVVSRAAIFGFVSLVVVALFLSFEWAAAQILERTAGNAVANGLVGQGLRLAIALAVGLSARPIHSFVERYLNRVFFGKRAQALATIRRFALEADLVTNSTELLNLTQETLDKTIEGPWSAVYMLSNGEVFKRASATPEAPLRLSENDSRVLRLRRWTEPFEAEVSSDSLSEALFVPMIVSGTLIGLIICGAKRERTHYLREEFESLEQLAHRVGIAYVLLQHKNQSLSSSFLAPA